jgi:hypothetical protein
MISVPSGGNLPKPLPEDAEEGWGTTWRSRAPSSASAHLEETNFRLEIIERLEAAERALSLLAPQHGGIGHNNPPDGPLNPDEHRAATTAAAEIRAEVATEKPDLNRLRRAAEALSRAATAIGRWLAKRAEVAVDKYIEATVIAAGVLTAADIAGAGESLNALSHAARNWIRALGGP